MTIIINIKIIQSTVNTVITIFKLDVRIKMIENNNSKFVYPKNMPWFALKLLRVHLYRITVMLSFSAPETSLSITGLKFGIHACLSMGNDDVMISIKSGITITWPTWSNKMSGSNHENNKIKHKCQLLL